MMCPIQILDCQVAVSALHKDFSSEPLLMRIGYIILESQPKRLLCITSHTTSS